MTDDMGRLVAQPLRCGGQFCVLHAKPFVVRPAPITEAMVLVFLDLEHGAQRTYAATSACSLHSAPRANTSTLRTTGVDVTRDRIVELAAAHAPVDGRLAGSSYSSVVAVDPQILQERGGAASLVHGITNEEIACGPSFAEAWGRFLQWTRALLDNAVREDLVDTDDDEPCAPQPEEAPILLLAGHNGVRALMFAVAVE